jgi:2,4-dienoyl-CoA reductase-like NADH-dependent reductase (Old Yellow Enzyme family)
MLRCGLELKNRVLMAPMTTEASEDDGSVSTEELAYLRRRARSGVSAVITSCAFVDAEGKSFRGIGASSDHLIESLARIANTIHDGGARAILQLYDGGRLSLGPPRAPSAVAPSRPNARVPREMSDGQIERLISAFAEAAERAVRAGFDGIELHGANHYMIHQFFSPRANHRTDHWGARSITAWRSRARLCEVCATRSAPSARSAIA